MPHVLLATSSSGSSAAGIIVGIAVYVVLIIAAWRVFAKAGRPGWLAIIPIVNVIVMLSIVGRPWWWIFGFVIPIVSILVTIVVANDVSKSYGHGVGFTIGLILLSPIFLLILGFGSSEYVGPAAA